MRTARETLELYVEEGTMPPYAREAIRAILDDLDVATAQLRVREDELAVLRMERELSR